MEEIVLYGAGLAGEKFYCRYKDRFRIKYVIDRNCGRLFHGANVYSFADKKDELKNEMIIVAAGTPAAYKEISAVLEENGLEEFKNYRSFENIDRDLAILYGNCHFFILEEYLRSNPVFNKQYHLRFHYVAGNDPCPKKVELEHCKLIISQDIQEDNALHRPGAEQLFSCVEEDCIKILVPNLYGYNLFFPQIQRPDRNVALKHINSEAILRKDATAKSQEEYISWISGWRDKNIEDMFEAGGKIDDIVDMIEHEDVYSAETILENFDNQIRKLQKREENCDIKISDYILENYMKCQMLYDPHHPTREVILEKGRRILNLLKIEINEAHMTISRQAMIDGKELFLYGCVRRALKIQYKQQYIRNNKNNSLYNRAMDLKEYVEAYIAWNCAK